MGAKRRMAGARQARARRGRVTASTSAPKGMGHTAPVEREGGVKWSGGEEVKGEAGLNKGRAAGEGAVHRVRERVCPRSVSVSDGGCSDDQS